MGLWYIVDNPILGTDSHVVTSVFYLYKRDHRFVTLPHSEKNYCYSHHLMQIVYSHGALYAHQDFN